ncbi:MAG: hypothetical protein LBT10_07515 [Methanobrevibacter sp.]|jgi:hypothetical protein|nr:hypothetical protein [Methanobrevibacter sp.]
MTNPKEIKNKYKTVDGMLEYLASNMRKILWIILKWRKQESILKKS